MKVITDPKDISGPVCFVGDIHGWLDRLKSVLAQCEGHVIFLGDLIDRGPDSAGVVRLIRSMVESGTATCLMGNHEWILCRVLGVGAGARFVAPEDPMLFARWKESWGGAATLSSYGATDTTSLRHRMGDDLGFIADLPWVSHGMAQGQPWLAVHAGLDDHEDYEDQVHRLQLGWSYREPTLDPRPSNLFAKHLLEGRALQQPSNLCVVSGHTPLNQVSITADRILCDTSGGQPGRPLSAVRLPDRRVFTSSP